MEQGRLIELQGLSFPSNDIRKTVFQDAEGAVTLRFTYLSDPHARTGGIRFNWVRAYRYRAESHCTAWQIDAYDTLVEVENSAWVAELLDAMPEDMRGSFEMHHYMIYLDSADSSGCYEVVAESWEFLPETAAHEGDR